MDHHHERTRRSGLVYLVLQKNQIYVPESPCGSLRYDGIQNRLVQGIPAAGLLRCIFQYPCHSFFPMKLMCMGKEKLEFYMAEIRKKGDAASKKEQDTLKDMRIVQEMYARGYDFMPIDIYRAKAHRFQIIEGKLMPSIDSIEGLGDKAADAVVDAAVQGRFLSKDDFRDRTKVSKTVIDLMDKLGLFGDIPQSNQISLFDF